MLQFTFYDTTRFDSKELAEAAKEIYKAEYFEREMKLTDPDGNITVIPLNYRPVAGLDVSDHAKLMNYLDSDMEKREKPNQ
jgi:allophanate hydrolase subunit 1